jgi:hypothetical protein
MTKQTRPRSKKTHQQRLFADQEPLFPDVEREIAARSRKPTRRDRAGQQPTKRSRRLRYDDDFERIEWERDMGYWPLEHEDRENQFTITFDVLREKRTRVSIFLHPSGWKGAA